MTSPTCTNWGEDIISCSVCKTAGQWVSVAPLGHTEKDDGNAKAASCTDTGLTESKSCSTCGTTTLAQTTIPAKGHDYWGKWSLSNHGKHIRRCNRGCGQYTTVVCQNLAAITSDATLNICPICGRYGNVEAELQEQATIANPATDKPGTFIARTVLYPIVNNAECIAAITAVYERNGHVIELTENAASVTVTLPLLTEAPCQLVFVTIEELTQEPVWTPVEYTIENGNMVFTVNQLGLFLLITE